MTYEHVNNKLDKIHKDKGDIDQIIEIIKAFGEDKDELTQDVYQNIFDEFNKIKTDIKTILLIENNNILHDAYYFNLPGTDKDTLIITISMTIFTINELFNAWTNYIEKAFIDVYVNDNTDLIVDVDKNINELVMAQQALDKMATNIIKLNEFILENSKDTNGDFLLMSKKDFDKEQGRIILNEAKRSVLRAKLPK